MTTTALHPKPVSTRQLTWDPTTRRYVGEISSTHGFGRVYADACDEGLTLVGRTGKEVTFVIDRESRTRDGDVESWLLVPADRRDREAAGVTVLLFND